LTFVEPLGSAFAPVKQRRAFEDIIVQVENAILEGRLKVGDRLPPERELAEIFNVSRASVREALRVLEAFGVLSARRGTGAESGSIVSAQNGSPLSGLLRLYASLLQLPITDLLDVREALEMLTARQAAERAGADEVARLGEYIESMRRAKTPAEFLALDTEFHLTLARASGNSVAPLILGAVRDAIARQMLQAFQALDEAGRWNAERAFLVKEHAQMVQTIAAHDPEAAATAFSHHVHAFYTRVLSGQEPKPAKRSAPARPAKKARPA